MSTFARHVCTYTVSIHMYIDAIRICLSMIKERCFPYTYYGSISIDKSAAMLSRQYLPLEDAFLSKYLARYHGSSDQIWIAFRKLFELRQTQLQISYTVAFVKLFINKWYVSHKSLMCIWMVFRVNSVVQVYVYINCNIINLWHFLWITIITVTRRMIPYNSSIMSVIDDVTMRIKQMWKEYIVQFS